MRPSEALRRATDYLERHGVESPRASAEALLMPILGTDRVGLYARTEGLSSPQARSFGRALCQRCAGVPLQHLTGRVGFRHLELVARPGVFVPRPETEILVEAALRVLDGVASPAVVDVGTGTGAVALSIKHERPEAQVVAVDVSAEAVGLARHNADRLGLDVEVLRGDLLSSLPSSLQGAVDLIVSNPPYVEPAALASLPADVLADPWPALVGGTDVHRALAQAAPAWLAPGGSLVLEIGESQGPSVAAILEDAGFVEVQIHLDLNGRDRVAVGRAP